MSTDATSGNAAIPPGAESGHLQNTEPGSAASEPLPTKGMVFGRGPAPTSAPPEKPATAAARPEQALRWWNPLSVLREYWRLQEAKRSGLCPVCDHGMHRDGPCDLCGDRCGYPKTIDAAQDRLAEARANFGMTVRADLARLFRRG